MVGVPGKYKGCETCRARRVKCDNQRPYCKKCLDSGRPCAGYERETVFIVGTVHDEGRCSSHPPRIVKSGSRRGGKPSSKASSRARSRSVSPAMKREKGEKVDLVPVPPSQPAWDDLITLSDSGKNYRVQTAALHTHLHSVVRDGPEAEASTFGFSSFPAYEPPNVQPSFADEEFRLGAQCMVHLDDGHENYYVDTEETAMGTDSICMFLFEHNNRVLFNNQPPWLDPSVQTDPIRQQGPGNFRTFPNHHFFVRVYRHNAILTALLNRKPTYLSSSEWLTTPWEMHPKAYLDTLFDTLSALPALFYRADHIFLLEPTPQRRLLAQDLLGNCLALERQLDAWHAGLSASSNNGTGLPVSYPEEDAACSDAQIPFTDPLAFPDAITAVTLVYYWTALMLLYPCVEKLHETTTAGQSPARYSGPAVRELAGLVCRSLDFALSGTTQPDLLAVPLYVAEGFYRGLGRDLDPWDGQLEAMWCEGFRARLATKGRDIAEVVADRGKRWVEAGRW